MSEKTKTAKRGINELANTDGELNGVKAGPDAEAAGEEMPKENKRVRQGAENAAANSDIPDTRQLNEKAKILGDVLGVYKDDTDFTNEDGQRKIKEWVSQFPSQHRLFILEELANVFMKSFIRTDNIEHYLQSVIENWAGGRWDDTTLLDVQGNEKSQHDLVDKFLTKKCLPVNDYEKSVFLYLDDALYTGNSFYNSLKELSAKDKLRGKKVCVRVKFLHSEALNSYKKGKRLMEDAGGELEIKCGSKVKCRYVGEFNESSHFTSDQNRIKLRDIFAAATEKFITNEDWYGVFGLKSTWRFSKWQNGFGSTIATYRNCPNNAPIALWLRYGSWTPLLPREVKKKEDVPVESVFG